MPNNVTAPVTPLRVSHTGGHRNDITQLLPLVDGLPPVRGKRGRPGASPVPCMPTVATTTPATAADCVSVASSRRSPGAVSPTARAWAVYGGLPSPPSHDSTPLEATRRGTGPGPPPPPAGRCRVWFSIRPGLWRTP